MTTKDLLAFLLPDALSYIRNTVNSKNRADYQKLKKLFEEQCFEARNFDDSQLDIQTFDWHSLQRDRNWWWQLQALPFLNWYANSIDLQTEEERHENFLLCLEAVHGWIKNAKDNPESPLVWHDHASAFRVRNLTNWLVFCQSKGLPVAEGPRAAEIAGLIIAHLDWLQNDAYYSKHTNHGFDQAMIALTVASMFATDDFEIYRERNRERLKDEITFAFTEEGVHKENSSGYQKMMLARLKQLRSLALLGEKKISQMGERYIENAEAFLKTITLPNGYLPLIGDTRGGDRGLVYEQTNRVDVLDYSASGYVVVRGTDGLDKEFFILLKNTHESNYHRHDDDLMLYVFYDGKVVLDDGGLLSHAETQPERIFLRSHFAHSVPYLEQSAIRRKEDLTECPKISLNPDNIFEAIMTSCMFGEKISRTVLVSHEGALEISVTDTRIDASEGNLFANFFFCEPVSVILGGKTADIHLGDFICRIENAAAESIQFSHGWYGTNCAENAIFSRDYGQFENANRVVLNHSSGRETIIKMLQP